MVMHPHTEVRRSAIAQVIAERRKTKTTLLSQTVPGLRPSGALRATRFTPGESVVFRPPGMAEVQKLQEHNFCRL
jgi:hypothetical protein